MGARKAGEFPASTSTVTNDDDKETARTTEEKQNRKEIEASVA
jgi:hypothetical protein